MSDLVDGRMVAADNGWHAEAAADAICMTTGIGRNGEESAGTERNEDVWRVQQQVEGSHTTENVKTAVMTFLLYMISEYFIK